MFVPLLSVTRHVYRPPFCSTVAAGVVYVAVVPPDPPETLTPFSCHWYESDLPPALAVAETEKDAVPPPAIAALALLGFDVMVGQSCRAMPAMTYCEPDTMEPVALIVPPEQVPSCQRTEFAVSLYESTDDPALVPNDPTVERLPRPD